MAQKSHLGRANFPGFVSSSTVNHGFFAVHFLYILLVSNSVGVDSNFSQPAFIFFFYPLCPPFLFLPAQRSSPSSAIQTPTVCKHRQFAMNGPRASSLGSLLNTIGVCGPTEIMGLYGKKWDSKLPLLFHVTFAQAKHAISPPPEVESQAKLPFLPRTNSSCWRN